MFTIASSTNAPAWLRGLVLAACLALPQSMGAASEFHIEEGGRPGGPFAFEALYAKVREGLLTPATLVWAEGQSGWLPAGEIPALQLLFVSPPPLPGAGPTAPRTAYYVDLGQPAGPFEGPALLELIRDGRLAPGTRVWAEGMDGWLPAGEVAELAPLLSPRGGPPPLPEQSGGPPPLPPGNDGPPALDPGGSDPAGLPPPPPGDQTALPSPPPQSAGTLLPLPPGAIALPNPGVGFPPPTPIGNGGFLSRTEDARPPRLPGGREGFARGD